VAHDSDSLGSAVTLSPDSDNRVRHQSLTDSDSRATGQGRNDSDRLPQWVAVADEELVGSLRGPDSVNQRCHADENASQVAEVTPNPANDNSRFKGHLLDNDTLSQVSDNDEAPPSLTASDRVKGTTRCDSDKKSAVCLIETDSDRGQGKDKDLDSDNSHQKVAHEAQPSPDHEGDKDSHSLLLLTLVQGVFDLDKGKAISRLSNRADSDKEVMGPTPDSVVMHFL